YLAARLHFPLDISTHSVVDLPLAGAAVRCRALLGVVEAGAPARINDLRPCGQSKGGESAPEAVGKARVPLRGIEVERLRRPRLVAPAASLATALEPPARLVEVGDGLEPRVAGLRGLVVQGDAGLRQVVEQGHQPVVVER